MRLELERFPCLDLHVQPTTVTILRKLWDLWFARGPRHHTPSHALKLTCFQSTTLRGGRKTTPSEPFARDSYSHPSGVGGLARAARLLLILRPGVLPMST